MDNNIDDDENVDNDISEVDENNQPEHSKPQANCLLMLLTEIGKPSNNVFQVHNGLFN